MQGFCVVDNEAPGFAPLPFLLAWVTPKCSLIEKYFLNIFQQKKKL